MVKPQIHKEDSKIEGDDMKETEEQNKLEPAPYEDPKVYFLKILLKNLPTGNYKSEKWEELFNLLTTLIKMIPTLFTWSDPYAAQNEGEDIDAANIFSANSILNNCINEINSRPTLEERHSDYEDKVLGGYMSLAIAILQICPQLKKYIGDSKGLNFTKKLFDYLFELPKIENKEANLPKWKSKTTRKKAFNLLLWLCQSSEEVGSSKHHANENYSTLFKELYLYHREMDEVEHGTKINMENFDSDVGLRSTSGFSGLKNFGATWYMNSVIQQLFMIPDFRYGVLSSEVKLGKDIFIINLDDKASSTLFQLQLTFANLQESEKKYYSPRDFTKTIRIEGGPVDVRRQQDAQEFFNVLSDNLENELKETVNEKLLKEIFGGEICSEIKSLEDEYEYVSQTIEPFFSVQLDIKNKKSIQEALDFYIKPDILEGDNKYYCEKYDKKIKVHKRAFINKASNTLIINLKRFEFDFNTLQKYKVNDYWEFPMELNIKPWTKEGIEEKEKKKQKQKEKSDYDSEDGIQDNENEAKKNDEEEKKKIIEEAEEDKEDQSNKEENDDKLYEYEAVGVVVHSGGAEGGHYYSYIKDRTKGKWFEFNDTQVKPFDLKDLAEETFGGEGKGGNLLGNNNDYIGDPIFSKCRNAYFIIYQRKYPQPLPSAQIVDQNHEYSKGIPKSIYQHIWDENMLFMKRMYFFDSEYLDFIRDFLALNSFERKLYIDHSPLTKQLKAQKEAAELLNVTHDKYKTQISLQSINIFNDREDLNFDDRNAGNQNMDVDAETDFNKNKPDDSWFKNNNFVEDENTIIVDIKDCDSESIEKAKALLRKSKNYDKEKDSHENMIQALNSNPAFYLIKFSTLFALKIKEQIKDSLSFISLLQQLNWMFEMHADGCLWLLKYLTFNKKMIVEHLLKNKSEEERENFRALLITAICLVAKHEEKEIYDKEWNDCLKTDIIVEYNEERDVFYAKQVPISALIRFMKVFFEEMLEDARENWKTYEDYFQVLFYFARLGYIETKYLVKSSGIFKLLDFVMNNSPPFHHIMNRK